ncbi:glycosyltransferase family 2 protein, partial [Candidatus Gottesmanbacteria bacterium]|nr:glycosyltransferase family 2 protein [Candidatus Gottesmanbacteria bacterium]
MKGFAPFGLPLGLSIAFWTVIGRLRTISEFFGKLLDKRAPRLTQRLTTHDVAVILPAHNEELVIRQSIQALKRLVDKKQIYVVSDGSTDQTYNRARKERCHVSYLNPGLGKAKALVYLLKKFNLLEKYKLIFIVDADTRIDKQFLVRALPFFSDPEISVVFGTARINWPKHIIPSLKLYFIAYRERLNRLLQFYLIYGQTWKYTNVNFVIPGFATIYRSQILSKLEIDTPGLLIEDFNLAFQLHKKGLGKIGYHPSLVGYDQHPDNLRDYWNQVRRWNIGFFQTVRKNGVWPSFFWVSLGLFTVEVTLNSIFTLFLPFLFLYLISPLLITVHPIFLSYAEIFQNLGPYADLTIKDLVIATFVFDYATSVMVGLIYKKPQFIIYGLFFFFMHYITSLILLSSI